MAHHYDQNIRDAYCYEEDAEPISATVARRQLLDEIQALIIDQDTRVDPSLLMPFLRLGKELGWDVELMSNGAQMLVKYYGGLGPIPVFGLVMGKRK